MGRFVALQNYGRTVSLLLEGPGDSRYVEQRAASDAHTIRRSLRCEGVPLWAAMGQGR
jgi:hypothetical protein